MTRIGFGYDIHAFAPGRPLVLGGVRIPAKRGLLGHSDADVLLHAICDALLGAAALGDIGSHFPDEDERFRGAPSTEFLKEVARLMEAHTYVIVNVDATVVLGISQDCRLRPQDERDHRPGPGPGNRTGFRQGNHP